MSQRHFTIKRQVLTFVILLGLGITLPMGGGLFFHHYRQVQVRLEDTLLATARITAATSSAALAFGDSDAATEILASLRHDPLISSAILYDQKNHAFSTYNNKPNGRPEIAPSEISVDVVHAGVTYGRLVLRGAIDSELRRTAVTWMSAYGIGLLVALVATVFIARRFQNQIANPLQRLANTALRITHERDYKARAELEGSAEITDLAIAFNAMIAEVARRDAKLAQKVEALNKEVREREAVESALRDNQHAMLKLSREAGMAEVAVGVLHNIGNVLTSINVSSDLLSTRLATCRRRPITNLRTLLDQPTAHTAAIFSAHENGHELRKFISSLSGSISTEIDESIRLLGITQTGIAHLKRIVSSQQSLARTSRISEPIVLHDALHEAITLARTVSRNFTPISESPADGTLVLADRSMVVQILLNLLINAHESILSHAPAKPCISVQIAPADQGCLTLSITDNGQGIASEKLVSIFTYGYTTKPKGHGFGLHNSANAARTLGGELQVSSPGLGLGATFTLSLPIHHSV